VTPSGGGIGDPCGSDSDCQSGLCGTINGQAVCTAMCQIGNGATCPGNSTCTYQAGQGDMCVATRDLNGMGGGCNDVPGHTGETGLIAFLILLAGAGALALRKRA
jgi:hypothetical protein